MFVLVRIVLYFVPFRGIAHPEKERLNIYTDIS